MSTNTPDVNYTPPKLTGNVAADVVMVRDQLLLFEKHTQKVIKDFEARVVAAEKMVGELTAEVEKLLKAATTPAPTPAKSAKGAKDE